MINFSWEYFKAAFSEHRRQQHISEMHDKAYRDVRTYWCRDPIFRITRSNEQRTRKLVLDVTRDIKEATASYQEALNNCHENEFIDVEVRLDESLSSF